MHDATLYTTANGLQRRDAREYSDEFSDEIGKMSGRCLDIGSGSGDTAVDFILPKLDATVSLVCSDVSEKMVNFGKEKYKNNERLSFVKLDIELPDLPQDLVEQFDHITSFSCLDRCRDMHQVFENIFDLLRPGGTTFLFFLANCPGMNAYKELAAMPLYQPYIKDTDRCIPVFQHYKQPRETLKNLTQDVNFEVRHCSVREQSYIFDGPDVLRKFVLAINPFKECIPADLMENYSKDLVNEFARQSVIFNQTNNNEDEYSVLVTYSLFIVYLKKPLAD